MKERSRLGLFIFAISLTVAVLVRNCHAAAISLPVEEEEMPLNDTSIEDDYYDYPEDKLVLEDVFASPASLNITGSDGTADLQLTSSEATKLTVNNSTASTAIAPPSSTTTTTTTTSSSLSPAADTNALQDDDTPPSIQPCPLECECTPETAFVNCSGVHFTQLPDELPVNVVSLDLSRNLLSEIDLNALTRFTELRELNLSQNQIHRIEKLAVNGTGLVGVRRLMSIDFTDNKLTDVLDPDTFEGLTELRKLTLSNNSISLPASEALFNLPHLEELYLRNCSLEGLSTDLFTNLNGLRVLDMSENPFKEEIDISTFEPLTAIKSLQIGLIEEDKVLELCTILMTIDVIQFPEFKISCFEYVNGYTFEQSMISNTPHPELEEDPKPSGDENTISVDHTSHTDQVSELEPKKIDETENAINATDPKTLLIPTSSTPSEPHRTDPTEAKNIEKQTSSVNPELMNKILLGVILTAFIGLIIGILCRRDCFGIKTRCCRTRKPSQTDQVTPAPEEVPLNKITTVTANGNGNGRTHDEELEKL